MNTERAKVGWDLWLWWMLASAGGSVVGAIVSEAVGVSVLGVTIGTAQWFILRRHVARAGWWVLASTVIWSVVPVIIWAVVPVISGAVGMAAVRGALLGALIGTAQWLILQWQIPRAGWWVLANTLFFAVFFAGGGFGLLTMVGYGAITGGVLLWLLRQSTAREWGTSQDAA